MDREILFRGMDDNKRLIQGYFFQIWEDCFILWGTTNGVPNMTKVAPATVGQYTGLCDKDGKKIFEGDKLYCEARLDKAEMYVVFEEGQFRMVLCDKFKEYETGRGYYDINCFQKTVIGNIHDTPDLVKEESE